MQRIKDFLYQLITRSSIVFYLAHVPGFGGLIFWLIFGRLQKEADTITDEGGATMKVTVYNGKRYPAFGKHRLSTLKDVAIRQDDVFLCGYPKTGCHWVFEILQMLKNKKAKLTRMGKGLGGMIDAMPDLIIDSLPSPRILNSHMLYEDLPTGIKEKGTKIILTIRSPKDTVVSYYNHTKNLQVFYNYNGEFHNYYKMFAKGETDYGCYFEYYLSWSKAMKTQSRNQIYLLKFEDLKKDTFNKVMDLAKFLDVEITPQFAEEVVEASKFSSMKRKHSKNKLLRKGEVGDWKNWLTEEQIKELDAKWEEKMVDFH